MTASPSPPATSAPRQRFLTWSNPTLRALVWQLLLLSLVVVAGLYIFHNTRLNLARRGIEFGYDFFKSPAGFDVSESVLDYDYSMSYVRAFLVGIANTFRVALLGIVFATIIGTLVGVGRLSRNALVRFLCTCYVESLRNVPLLLQLFVWYFVAIPLLPDFDNPLHPLPGSLLSKVGLSLPKPEWDTGWTLASVALLLALVLLPVVAALQRRRQEQRGRSFPLIPAQLLMLVALPLLAWWLGGAPNGWDIPVAESGSVTGGMTLTPEFVSLLVGLSLYTATFIAEVVRGGILAVPKGQTEAAQALGLHYGQSMRLVLLPQALRVIIPPVTNQFLNLTKNSSLAIAIGYPDVVAIANTTVNQSGRALEAISVLMAVYLTLSLLTSTLMNWYNARKAIKER